MLKIHQFFFRTYIIISFFILIIFALIIYFWAKNIYLEQIEKSLSQSIDTLTIALEDTKGVENIKSIVNHLHKKLNIRISIIDENGQVLNESDKDPQELGNHSNRTEILEAKKSGIGKDIRVSQSIEKSLLYVAKKVTLSDKIYYIRMADYVDNIKENFIKLALEIFFYVLLFLVILFLATYFISLKIKNETYTILDFLTQLTNKKDAIFLKSTNIYEFYKIAELLNKVAIKLSKRDKQKAKQTAKLKLSNRQKDEIISAISHEFKNPIAIISGYSETILSDKDLSPAMKTKFLEKIYSNSNKMAQLVDKLRLTLKLESKIQELVLTHSSIKKIVENCISDLKDKYKNREIFIKGEDTLVNVDETLFSMAISNLIENALKYSKNEVIIELEKDFICIIDKGIGIKEDELEKINKKFYRVSNNSWNNSLGLGLFIVQSVLNLHNFSLEIESKIDEGSKFYIKWLN